MTMSLGFSGEAVDFYHRYRRGYPPPVIDLLVQAFDLTHRDIVVDLGCGTGQLTLPMAERVRAVVAVDPEPDMLQRACQTGQEQGATNATWMIGTDADIGALGAAMGSQRVGAVTVAQALHWMNHERLFASVFPLIREGGGVAIVTNGTPLWLQDSSWSHALRDYLDRWFDTKSTASCGNDTKAQQLYGESLRAAGFDLSEATFDYIDELSIDEIVGSLYSALGGDKLPAPDQRTQFAEGIQRELAGLSPFVEPVHVAMLFGRVPS